MLWVTSVELQPQLLEADLGGQAGGLTQSCKARPNVNALLFGGGQQRFVAPDRGRAGLDLRPRDRRSQRAVVVGHLEGSEAELTDVLGNYGIAAMTLFTCLLYTSDAADDLLCVDLGGR